MQTSMPNPDRIFASPLARRLARERGIDLNALKGSGPQGRIVKHDVEMAAIGEPAETAEPRELVRRLHEAPAEERGLVPTMSDETILALYDRGTYDLVPHDTMRRFIADRVTLAKQTIPHFYLTIDCTSMPS